MLVMMNCKFYSEIVSRKVKIHEKIRAFIIDLSFDLFLYFFFEVFV